MLKEATSTTSTGVSDTATIEDTPMQTPSTTEPHQETLFQPQTPPPPQRVDASTQCCLTLKSTRSVKVQADIKVVKQGM